MSEFNVITPLLITDAILTGSTVPEADVQEYSPGTAYAVGDTVIVATSTPNIHKIYECLVAQSAGLTADLLNEDCSDISDWTNGDTYNSVSEVSPAGQFRFDANIHTSGNFCNIRRTISSPPNTFTLEIKSYFDGLGLSGVADYFSLEYQKSTWKLKVIFASDGLFIFSALGANAEVGVNIVKFSGTAAWQTWRFQVTKTTESTATVTVYLKEETGDFISQGTVDCDYETAGTNGLITISQSGVTTDNMLCHVDYIKVATGLGKISNTDATPAGSSDWFEIGSTNRWKAFNGILGSQSEQATKIEYVLTPGEVIDSVALLSLESDTVDIVEIDTADALLNESAWTGATGTTQSTGWNKIGTPSDYTIDGGMIRITVDAASEGQSKTIAVTPYVEYQLLGLHKNTSGSIAQFGVLDNTHAANIKATTDFSSVTENASFSYVFTAPAGCTSVEIKLMAKTSGDIVWFDQVILCPTEYSETVTTGASKTNVIKTDIPQKAAGILTVTIKKSGTTAIGELKIGTKTYLGKMRPRPQVGFRNLSTLDEDTFGNIDIVSRGYKQKLICSIVVPSVNVDSVYKFLCDRKDDMMVYSGSEIYSCLQLYGFAKEPQIVLEVDKVNSDMSLEIWSVI